ncbi:hypothetical protein GCM10023323_24090 [Streptomyces thinghirensis]|uniref:Uncharacterized protein n=1 Tax=Streptomyces thinghirensis TaxID=551547 RepID=A0ABP9T468_9ACTN
MKRVRESGLERLDGSFRGGRVQSLEIGGALAPVKPVLDTGPCLYDVAHGIHHMSAWGCPWCALVYLSNKPGSARWHGARS